MHRFLPPLFILLLCTCGRAPETEAVTPPDATPYVPADQGEPSYSADGNLLTIGLKNQTATFDLATGGRLASFTHAGKELLKTTRDADDLQWGSTVWTSPQSAWNWPPEATFDRNAFTVQEATASSVTLVSGVDPATKLQLTKTFIFSTSGKGGLHLGATYNLFNRGDQPVGRGLWENTRLPYGGDYLFVVDSMRVDKLADNFATRGDATVVTLQPGDGQKGKLFIRPTKGKATWAYNGLRLRKLWYLNPDYDVAPGQAPLEIYLDAESGFTEFEIQGVYKEIQPGEGVGLSVDWQVVELVETD